MTPESKKDQLLAQEVGQELVVYDQQTHTAHRLNRTAALVWRLADGKRTTAELAKILHDAAEAPEDEDLVRMALAELDKSGLLLSRLPKADEAISRRQLFSLGAALIPVVASIAVPSAQACTTPNGTTATSPDTPVITITSPSPTGGVYYSTEVTLSFSSCAGKTGTGAVSSYTYQVDGGTAVVINVATLGSPVSATVTGLSSGSHSIKVTATNAAGATSNTLTFTTVSLNQTFVYVDPGGGNPDQSLVIPAGVTSILVDAYGAEGATVSGVEVPGKGGRIQTTVTVVPGETLTIRVGGQGSASLGGYGGAGNSFGAGGGGGGASAVLRNSSGATLVMAGGGGGGGTGTGGVGGGGGGATGGAGGTTITCGGGGGGTQSAGGAGGVSSSGSSGSAGALATGGQGGSGINASGGGGGGGYYGGGGGSASDTSSPGGGGGGGGSSYSSGTSTTHTQGARPGNGQITVTG